MLVKLSSSVGYEEIIHHFRADICARLMMDKDGPAGYGLPYSSYLFIFKKGQTLPIGMTEFFFYDQAYPSYQDSPYGQVADLASIAPMSAMAHLRSVYIADSYQKTRAFFYLLTATIRAADAMGASFFTAGTGLRNEDIVGLHSNAKMSSLGTYEVNGCIHQLSLLPLTALAHRVSQFRIRPAVFEMDQGQLKLLRAQSY